MIAGAALGAATVLAVLAVARLWRHRRPPTPVSGRAQLRRVPRPHPLDSCRVCGRPGRWELGETWAHDDGFTGMFAYYCRRHRPKA